MTVAGGNIIDIIIAGSGIISDQVKENVQYAVYV